MYSYLKQAKMSLKKIKMENGRAEQVLYGGLVPVGGGRI
jgi:hypothetical protein